MRRVLDFSCMCWAIIFLRTINVLRSGYKNLPLRHPGGPKIRVPLAAATVATAKGAGNPLPPWTCPTSFYVPRMFSIRMVLFNPCLNTWRGLSALLLVLIFVRVRLLLALGHAIHLERRGGVGQGGVVEGGTQLSIRGWLPPPLRPAHPCAPSAYPCDLFLPYFFWFFIWRIGNQGGAIPLKPAAARWSLS